MTAIITNKYRVFNVESFIRDLEIPSGRTSPDSYLYLFIGNSNSSWSNTHTGSSDIAPPEPTDSVDSDNFLWENMIALKRILVSEVSHGIINRKWSAGKFYDIYRGDYGVGSVSGVDLITGAPTYPKSLELANYYVVTLDGRVYICLDNNGGIPSTENPQDGGYGVGYSPFVTGDGYKWKYVTSVSSADYSRFSTIGFHPVKKITTQPMSGDSYEHQYYAQENAIADAGAIHTILITNAGNNTQGHTGTIGSTGDQTMFNIYGDGEGLQISAQFSGVSPYTLQKINVLTSGRGYTYCYITIDGVDNTVFEPIFTPMTGLGADPRYDLNANYLLVNTKLEGNEYASFMVGNSYRQIGLVVNPRNYNNSVANKDTLNACYTLGLTGTGLNFTQNSQITNINPLKGTTARVVKWDGNTNALTINLARPYDEINYAQFDGFAIGDHISELDGAPSATDVPIASVTNPEIKKHSGRIIYYENRIPIIRTDLQVEDIHLVLEY